MNKSALEKDVQKFINDINLHLICSQKEKKIILSDMKNSISDYIESSNAETIQDVYKHFGTAETVAKSFNDNVEPKRIKNIMNFRKILIASFSVIIASLIIFFIALFADSYSNNRGYYVVDEASGYVQNISDSEFNSL